MKKLVGSIITTVSLFVTINAMEPEMPHSETGQLYQAVKNRNLESVFSAIEQAGNKAFFESLNLSDQYWLLLAIFDYELTDASDNSDACARILLNNMYTVFGYEDLSKFRQERNNFTPFCFIRLLAERNVHETIQCASVHGLEKVMCTVLDMHDLLTRECSYWQYQSLTPLYAAINNGHAGVIKIILDKLVPYLLETDHYANDYIWYFAKLNYEHAVCHAKNHPEHKNIVDVFLNNTLVATHVLPQLTNNFVHTIHDKHSTTRLIRDKSLRI